ncbi:dimethyl sulfoxide reductase anchor subunit family protein [Siccibacter turicensis]|uniref:dimethyl sulfoxide reductase anchor subunit family protein n=1 Tax=Siccibacter turicensis TaxID=357233 RepID=UPI00102192CD|nr:dimethyl sulfoxide reductase anchor subunit family protein [Siccibacter turicensis]
MGNGWHEWPLVLFTVLGQCVVGGTIVTGGAWLACGRNSEQQQRIVRAMFFLWVLMGAGFIASMMHLGSPLRAFNSLNRIGESALSNEIASGSLFFALGGFWWLLTVLGKMPAALGKLWLVVTMLAGLVFVQAMTLVYQIDTVPTWYTGYTTLGFFMTVLLGGPLLGATLLSAARYRGKTSRLALVSVLALLVSIGAALMQGVSLAAIASSVQQASALVPDYGMLQIWRMALLVLGLACWIVPLVRRSHPQTAVLATGFVLVVVAEMIGRGVFYGLHMTVGMAVAG